MGLFEAQVAAVNGELVGCRRKQKRGQQDMEVRFSGLFEDWQKNARELLKKNVPPRDVLWSEESGQQPLFAEAFEQ